MQETRISDLKEHEKLLLAFPVIAQMNFVDGDYRKTIRQPERDIVLIKRTNHFDGSIVYEKQVVWEDV